MRLFKLSLLLVFVTIFSCSKKGTTATRKWLIPEGQVRDGGPGKDGIPSVDNPQFIAVGEVDFLQDDDLVEGVVYKGKQRAYPHAILDWHEIVNDDFDDISYALTYCPLTGTGIAWDRVVDGQLTTFGVSGKLYNNNLMPYDRRTDSYWSQLKLLCVNGTLIGTEAATFPTIETTWKTWKKMYPNSEVLSKNTGYSRNYGVYPYGGYKTDNDYLLFPNSINDDRLPSKERVLGVLNKGANRVYSLNLFATPKVIFDTLGDDELIVIGSQADNFIVAFRKGDLDGFTLDLSQLPVLGMDNAGNALTIDGRIVEGPLSGTRLEQPISFMGYWFAFGTFYAGIGIYE